MYSAWPSHIHRGKFKMPTKQGKSLARKAPKAMKEVVQDEILEAITNRAAYLEVHKDDKELAEGVRKMGIDLAKSWGFVRRRNLF
jgi:hypothetical protein